MKKYFFITVQTYSSVNNMGRKLAQYVYDKYDHTVMLAENMDHVEKDIRSRMASLEVEFPRCRPLEFKSLTTRNRYGDEELQFYACPQTQTNDNMVFTLRTDCIRKLAIQTTIGG
ncbi:MAG: hypothetical protein IJ868_00670 [Prevotella sp.]|nr:hypothetical protein [Prevotella sp.]